MRRRLGTRTRLAQRFVRARPRLTRTVRRVLVVAVWGLLVWRLTHLGWGDVLRALPAAPGFYALVLAIYCALPLSDAIVYGPWWRVPRRGLMAASFRKRVLNEDVVEYAGEAAFIEWAEREGVPRGLAFRHVRDNNIVSAAVSMAVTLGVASAALAWSGVGWNDATERLAVIAALPLVVMAAVLAALRRRAFALSTRETLRVAAINTGRMLLVLVLTVWMWETAVPATGLKTWVVLLATQLLVSRIPLVPAKDLLFVTLGVSVSGAVGAAQAAVASALLVQVAVTKALNVSILLGSGLTRRTARRSSEAPSG